MNSEAEAGVGVGFPGGSGAPNNDDSPAAAIINPTREAWDDPVTARVILTFTLPDYRYLCRLVQPQDSPRYVYNCALREGRWDDQPITLAAPALGAPYAVMVMEKLMVLGPGWFWPWAGAAPSSPGCRSAIWCSPAPR